MGITERFAREPWKLAEFGARAFTNALDLANEAQGLEQRGHLARGFALRVLAAEELAKGFAASWLIQDPSPESFDVLEVVMSPDHRAKIRQLVRLIERRSAPEDEVGDFLLMAMDESVQTKKLRALYVDLRSTEGLVGPWDLRADADALKLGLYLTEGVFRWAPSSQIGLWRATEALRTLNRPI